MESIDKALEMSDLEYISDEVDFKPSETTPPAKKTAWSKGPQGSVKDPNSKSSSPVSPKNPLQKRSAWSMVTTLPATMPSPRSHPSTPVSLTRSSTLGQAAPLNDGNNVSKPNLSTSKITFRPNFSATTSASLMVAPASEPVVPFGSLSPMTRMSTSSTTPPSSSVKTFDLKSPFQDQQHVGSNGSPSFQRDMPNERTQGEPLTLQIQPLLQSKIPTMAWPPYYASDQVGNTSLHNQHAAGFEPVAPLQVNANRSDRKAFHADPDSSEVVYWKVKGLLNKLTMEKFDSISDQIIEWANKSENEKDGRTLIQVIKLVFEKATESTWSEMYARLCRKMMEQISPKVQDDRIKDNEGKPIAGGQLFRKYLLNRCQEDFERGWVAKEAAAAAAATKATEDQIDLMMNLRRPYAVTAANEKKDDGKEVALYSDGYYAAQKAKRQSPGLIKFFGELFKLQMLTERIMHECVKRLLRNVDNPEEEEIESLCTLFTTVGSILDTQRARAHMDLYFSRMKELTKSLHVTSRMQFMLQDVLELRERNWIARQSQSAAAPTTLAQVHEAAAKEKAAQEKEAYQRQMSMSRGGSRRGGDNGHPQVGPDGWIIRSNAPRPRPKVGDLSNFGKISKGQPMTFGPSSVFAGKKTETKKESISRTASNMLSMLSSQTAENGDAAPKPTEFQRKRIILQPRSKPVEAAEPAETASPTAESDNSVEQPASPAPEMSEDSAMKKIAEDVKVFFNVRNTQEDAYFTELPHKYRSKLVEKLVGHVVEAKEAEARLLSDFFGYATSKEICSSESFEEGFVAIAEIIDDIIYDAPKALDLFAIVIKGAALDESRSSNIASKSSENSDKLLGLLH